MKIGVSCTQFAVEDPMEILEKVSEHFSHWEIFSEWKHDVISLSGSFMETMSRYDMSYSVHAPITDINIAALNDRVRENAVSEMVTTIEHASRMGVKTVTIHPGVYSMVLSDVRDRSVSLSKMSMRTIEKASAEHGVIAAIENMPSFPILMGQTADQLLDIIDGTDLGICFDIGHANTVGDISEFVDKFKDRIANIHIHDNNGDRDAHMTIGDGNIDFIPILRKLSGYAGNYIIESKDLNSAIESKRRLERLF